MSNYVPSVLFETEFEGDKVSMKLRQLTRRAFMGWSKFFSRIDSEGNLSANDTIELVNAASDLLPEFVSDFRGLRTADGEAVTIQEVCDNVYFMELTTSIVMRLIEISRIGKGKREDEEQAKGKSEGPSPELSME